LARIATAYRERPDFSKGGGLYSTETLKEFDYYREFGKTKENINTHFANSAGRDYFHNGGALRADLLFPEMKDPAWFSGMWDRTKGFLHRWGEAASIAISLYGIFTFGSSAASWFFRAKALKDVHGFGVRLLWSFCPNLFLLRRYRAHYVDETAENPRKKEPLMPLQRNDVPGDNGDLKKEEAKPRLWPRLDV
jgi:hypothetical protein